MAISVQSLVNSTRVDADAENDPIVSDSQIAQFISDGGSALYDRIVQANQYYNVKTFDFTLAGGLGGNTVALPDNHLQGHGLEMYPGTPRPISVPYLSNWLDRNRFTGEMQVGSTPSGRAYTISDSSIIVFPPTASGAPYRHYFTPTWGRLMIPQSLPASGSTPASINAIGAGGGGLTPITFNNAAWTSASVGDSLVIANSSNGNDGSYVIAQVVDNANIYVSANLSAESSTPVTATVQPADTSPTLPTQMNGWQEFLRLYAQIKIYIKRGQSVAEERAQLKDAEARIMASLSSRVEEPRQPPLTRRLNDIDGWDFGF